MPLGSNSAPLYPKPLPPPFLNKSGKIIKTKLSKSNKIKYLKESISYMKERLVTYEGEKPLMFRKQWNKNFKEMKQYLSDLEYKLMSYEYPEVIAEVETL